MGNERPTILIVDDDQESREVILLILRSEGYRGLVAANGKEALAALRRAPSCDLILLDLMMPQMNGWEFRAEQLRDETLAKIPVVLLSAGARVEESAVTLGAVAHLAKPIHLEDLLETIERCRRRAPR